MCRFMVSQLGLCAFKWEASTAQYKAACWNLPVFPQQSDRQAPVCFSVQPSSFAFLADHGFDFNKSG